MRIAVFHSPWFAVIATVVVFTQNVWLAQRGSPVGNAIAAAYMLLYGAYCMQNYVACKEIHCGFTGPGFTLAGLLMLVRTTAGAPISLEVPWLVFAAAACIGFCVEHARTRT